MLTRSLKRTAINISPTVRQTSTTINYFLNHMSKRTLTVQVEKSSKMEKDNSSMEVTKEINEELQGLVNDIEANKEFYNKIYTKIIGPENGHETPKQQMIRFYAFWLALAEGSTMDVPDVLSVFFQADSNCKDFLLAKAAGRLIKNCLLKDDDLDFICTYLSKTNKYLKEASVTASIDTTRNQKPLPRLLYYLNNNRYLDPETFIIIDLLTTAQFFTPILVAFKELLEKRKLWRNNLSEEELSTFVNGLNKTSYENDKDYQKFVNKLVDICIKYFSGSIKSAAEHPGIVPEKMKRTAVFAIQRYLSTFFDQAKIKFGNSVFFIAEYEDPKSKTKEVERVIMKLEKVFNDKNDFEIKLIKVEEELFKGLGFKAEKIKTRDIIEVDSKFYVMAEADNPGKAAGPTHLIALLGSGPNGVGLELVTNEELRNKVNSKFVKERDAYANKFVHSSYKYSVNGNVMPYFIIKRVAEVLNNVVMGSVVIGQFIEDTQDKLKGKKDKEEGPKKKGFFSFLKEALSSDKGFSVETAELIANYLEKIMVAVMAAPMTKLATTWPEEGYHPVFPRTNKEQSEFIGVNTAGSKGQQFIRDMCLEKLVGNAPLQKWFADTQMVFVADQDQKQADKPVKELKTENLRKKHVKDITLRHYEILQASYSPEDMKAEEFNRIALIDMLMNNFPLPEIPAIKEISENYHSSKKKAKTKEAKKELKRKNLDIFTRKVEWSLDVSVPTSNNGYETALKNWIQTHNKNDVIFMSMPGEKSRTWRAYLIKNEQRDIEEVKIEMESEFGKALAAQDLDTLLYLLLSQPLFKDYVLPQPFIQNKITDRPMNLLELLIEREDLSCFKIFEDLDLVKDLREYGRYITDDKTNFKKVWQSKIGKPPIAQQNVFNESRGAQKEEKDRKKSAAYINPVNEIRSEKMQTPSVV